MIYFDNAATGGFKPSSVIESAINTLKYLVCNPGRSSHRLAIQGEEMIFNTRKILAEFFNNDCIERVIFTKNCTESLNVAINGVVKEGDHVITTVFEHNSVLRPLCFLKNKRVITLDVVKKDKEGFLQKIKEKVNSKTKLICCNHVSNVNGEQNKEIEKIGAFCKENDITFLVDGAQSAGHIKIDMQKQNIDILCIPTHKGMYGIIGGGVLLFNKKTELSPLLLGGTGTETFNQNQPSVYPERLESGTVNLPLIASFFESVLYVKQNLNFFAKRLTYFSDLLVNELKTFERIKVYSSKNPFGIVAFSVENLSSLDVGDFLNKNYDIAVRSGFHCAPLMHEYLGTEKDGLTRISLSSQNTENELYFLLNALKKLVTS